MITGFHFSFSYQSSLFASSLDAVTPRPVDTCSATWQQRFTQFEQIADQCSSNQLSTSLNVLSSARAPLRVAASGEHIDFLLDTVVTSLWKTVEQDYAVLPAIEKITLLSALAAVGEITLMRGETEPSRQRVLQLYQTAASYLKKQHQRDVKAEGLQLFQEDRYLINMVFSLRGWLPHGQLMPDQQEAICALLMRIGVASVATLWPNQILPMPGVAYALEEMFGIGLTTLSLWHASPGAMYYSDAIDWQNNPEIFADYALIRVLEAGGFQGALRVLREGCEKFPADERLQQMLERAEAVAATEEKSFYSAWIMLNASLERPLLRQSPRIADFIVQAS